MTYRMEKTLGSRLLYILLTAATVFGVAFATHAIVWSAPFIRYKLRRPDVRSQCAAIHRGMTIQDVYNVMRRGRPPLDEFQGPTQISFGDWDQCQIDLAPNAEIVVNAHMVVSDVRVME